jgi:TonB-dependent starch-binding outer membrane protein SusC
MYCQESKISVSYTDATLREIFQLIESESGYVFFYEDNQLPSDQQFSAKHENKAVKSILTELLYKTDLTFLVLDKQIVVRKILEPKKVEEYLVRGKVINASDGKTIPGVNVMVKGTNKGTITDPFGLFDLYVPETTETLHISCIGYKTLEIPFDGERYLDIELPEKITGIEEVVIVGYGLRQKEDITSSVSYIPSEKLEVLSNKNFYDAIRGKVPGMIISKTSGMPGAGFTIRLRGAGSINVSDQPLYVIDGIPIDDKPSQDYLNPLSFITTENIANIQVLKDASAAAIYGAKAANGVIIITTKKGTNGKTKLHFTASGRMSNPVAYYDILNAERYSSMLSETYETYKLDRPYYKIPGFYSDSARHANQSGNTDWLNKIQQQGFGHDYNLNIASGNENSSFFVSGNYYREDGILVNTGVERLSATLNSDFNFLQRFRIGETLTISSLNSNNEIIDPVNGYSPWRLATLASPLMNVYKPGSANTFSGPVDSVTGPNDITNPLALQKLLDNETTSLRILTGAFLEIDLVKGVKYKMKIGFDYKDMEDKNWSPDYQLGNTGEGSQLVHTLLKRDRTRKMILLENYFTYYNSFKKHSLTVLSGHSVKKTTVSYLSAEGTDFETPGAKTFSQANEVTKIDGDIFQNRFQSFIFRLFYDYNGKYLLSATFRRDGSSLYSPANRYGNYPSVSAAWKFNEDFLAGFKKINLLKLRFGWGIAGNDDIGNYIPVSLPEPADRSQYVFGRNQDTYYGRAIIRSQTNSDIRRETATMYNAGLDFFCFKNKLQFIFDYYIKNQHDILIHLPLSYVYGKETEASGFTNLGKMRNSGFDISLNYTDDFGKLNYAVYTTVATLNNEVIDLPVENIHTDYSITTVGYPVGSFYGYVAEGIFQDLMEVETHAIQETGTSPGDIKYKDLDENGVINSDDMTIIGNPLPDVTYGAGFNLSYGIFDLSASFYGMHNVDIYNELKTHIGLGTDQLSTNYNRLADVWNNHWSEDNLTHNMTRLDFRDENNNARPSSWFVEDASFLKLAYVELGVNLNTGILKRLGFLQFRVFAGASNILLFNGYSGPNPGLTSFSPLESNIDKGYYPVPKTYITGLELGF